MSTLAKSVVVPLDGSEFAERAIGIAKVLASTLDADVGVVQVVSDERDADSDYLTRTVQTHGLDWQQIDVTDEVAGSICATATAREGVVCMATHGHGRATAVFGSTAENVLAASPTPIVVVGRGVAAGRTNRIERIVVALDGSPESEHVCAPAIDWARQLGLVVVLITVAAEPLESLRDDAPMRRSFGVDDPDAYIAEAVARHRTEGVEVIGDALIDPISPASGLGQRLRGVPNSLLAMGTSGRTGAQRIIHGSVAGTIVESSPVPVVMFKLDQPG